jgi:iron complex outermembrane recepter protein
MSKLAHKEIQRLPLAIAVIAALQVTPAFARDQSSPTPAGQATSTTDDAKSADKVKNLETVSVTGSLLKRPEYETTSPVQVIEVKNNIAAGQFDTADFLQTSSAAAGTTQFNGQFGGYVIEGGTGVQTVNLRGLGANRTLVLLDGQRPGPAGTRGQVGSFDLNVIPQVVLSRIEIVKDGSSSIYGSDAVSGVINLITKKSIDRPEINFATSITEHGGGNQSSLSLGNGWNFSKGSVIVAAQVDRLQPLKVGDRDFLGCSQDRVWGKDGARIDRADHSILQGTDLAGCNNLYANTIISYSNPNIRYVPSKDGSTIGPFPGYHPRPFPTKTYANSPQAYHEDVNNFPFYGSSYAINKRDRASLYAASNFSFGSVNWKTQFLYNQRETKTHAYRQFYPYVANPSDGKIYRVVMPYLFDTKQTVNYLYGNTSLEGLFASTKSWSWQINAGYSRSSGDYRNNAIVRDKTGDMLYVDTPPPSSVNYFDPSILSGQKMNDLINAVGATTKGNTLYTQATVKAVATGNLFALPAGDVAAAFGAEYRHYAINDQPDELSKSGGLWGQSSANVTRGTDNVKEIFSEIDVPLLKGITGIESLSANVSGRLFQYGSVKGKDNVWKAGLNWQITPTFRMRSTLGTSFRAPGLYELYLGDQTAFGDQASVDPCYNWGDSTNDRIRKNCAAAGIPDNYVAPGGASATIHSGGGKGFLKPETSRAKTLGFVWTPSFANLNLAVDYFDYLVKGEITNLSAADLLAGCYASTVYPNNFCDMFTRNPGNAPANAFNIVDVYSVYTNINRERTRGYDLQVNYDKNLSIGKLSAEMQVTYTIEDTSQLFDSAEASGFSTSNQVGYIGRPKTVGIADLSLKRGDWTYNWQGQYVSTTKKRDLDSVYTYLGYRNAARDIKAGWQLRHSVSATWDRGNWNLMFGIRNLFDKAPDLISPSAGTAIGNTPLYASQYDWYGRTFFARVDYKF